MQRTQKLAGGLAMAAALLGASPAWADAVPLDGAAVAAPAGEFRARSRHQLLRQRRHVADRTVTVTVPPRSCAGAIVGSQTQVLTAAHCIPEGVDTVNVVFRGRTLQGVVALIDRVRDTALLALDEEVDVEPLALDTALPRPGDRVLFVGRVDRSSRAQVAEVRRLGRCPSLPGVPNAVFTNLSARPGDSGAPILNDSLRVVGVIHGGAACHVAAPTAALAQELAALGRAERPSTPPAPEPPAAEPADDATPSAAHSTYRFGPFVFEKVRDNGAVRYRVHFQLGR